MPDAITFEPNGISHIVSDQFKAWMSHPLGNILLAAREIVIKTDHFLAGLHQAINQMGTDETGSTRHQIDQKLPEIFKKVPRMIRWMTGSLGIHQGLDHGTMIS